MHIFKKFKSLENEIIIKGNLFHKGQLKIVVSKLFHAGSNEPQPLSNSHLVEISCTGPPGQVNYYNIL